MGDWSSNFSLYLNMEYLYPHNQNMKLNGLVNTSQNTFQAQCKNCKNIVITKFFYLALVKLKGHWSYFWLILKSAGNDGLSVLSDFGMFLEWTGNQGGSLLNTKFGNEINQTIMASLSWLVHCGSTIHTNRLAPPRIPGADLGFESTMNVVTSART